jgi:hypothetical protein
MTPHSLKVVSTGNMREVTAHTTFTVMDVLTPSRHSEGEILIRTI